MSREGTVDLGLGVIIQIGIEKWLQKYNCRSIKTKLHRFQNLTGGAYFHAQKRRLESQKTTRGSEP